MAYKLCKSSKKSLCLFVFVLFSCPKLGMFFLACPSDCPFFSLERKEPKVQVVFVLLAWPKSTKRSRLRLLSYSVSSFRCARRKLASLRQRRSGRSTPFLRLTLTRTRPVQLTIDNWQLTTLSIENGELKIIFFSSFIHGTCLATVEAQRAAPHNDSSHNPIIINNIPNIFIVLFVVLSCRLGMEAQRAAPLLAFLKLNGELYFPCNPWNPCQINCQLSILNFQLMKSSIDKKLFIQKTGTSGEDES